MEADRAFVRLQSSGHQIQHGALAGAVGPDQAGDGALLYLERAVADRAQAAERAAHTHDAQRTVVAHLPTSAGRLTGRPASSSRRAGRGTPGNRALRSGMMPCGRKYSTRMRTRPMITQRSGSTRLGLIHVCGSRHVASRKPTGTRIAPRAAPQLLPSPCSITAAKITNVSGTFHMPGCTVPMNSTNS